ncbi:MAG TPA: NAD-dependent epimerase/dehydratase family protein [Labilithrix sp.]|jgi:dTDP-L-rhamnose 4-epimerase|nr:NAD-dependent epimerase/dehydratase family protein [Labilithrix sp.]
MRSILITGGAGFIGSHLADELLARGYRVRALDNLTPQVHGASGKPPEYLASDVELVVADIRDSSAVTRALEGIDAVVHLAAAVGVGQSMYDVEHYTSVNNVGTAVLMERLIRRPVERLVVASSMSVYGEGLFRDADGGVCEVPSRTLEQLKRGEWELVDGQKRPLYPAPTPETKSVTLESIYALSKFDQERMCLMLGRAYGIPTVALRFFNVFGTRQALSNPYTGVLAIFASRLLNGGRPLVFEDGNQRRDFVSVHDVARACRLALEKDAAAGMVLNIGSGRSLTVAEIARKLGEVVEKSHLVPQITGQYRMGDVRHCFADISRASSVLGYAPEIGFDRGLSEVAQWLESQVGIAKDRVDEACAELEARGLTL